MDQIQYQQLLDTQKATQQALREQKDKVILDNMWNKTNYRLMQNLLQGFHLMDDHNEVWGEVFRNKSNQEHLVSVANMEKINAALVKQWTAPNFL